MVALFEIKDINSSEQTVNVTLNRSLLVAIAQSLEVGNIAGQPRTRMALACQFRSANEVLRGMDIDDYDCFSETEYIDFDGSLIQFEDEDEDVDDADVASSTVNEYDASFVELAVAISK